MKAQLKYISLLAIITSGLILSFLITHIPTGKAGAQGNVAGNQSKVRDMEHTLRARGFSFFNDMAKNLFPVLKSLN